jgi:hypothetical protein
VTPFACRHFSLRNALEDRPADLPHLLRRMADAIEAEGIVSNDILGVTVSNEVHEEVEDGYWWAMSIYWSPEREEQSES